MKFLSEIKNSEKKNRIAGLLVIAAGVVLIYTGVQSGEPQVVLEKAINICMECIGIG